MSRGDEDSVVYTAADLLPGDWRHFQNEGPVRVFNPGLLRDGAGWLFAYRVVGPDGLRRIGVCRLTTDWQVVPGSQFAWSDQVHFRHKGAYPEIVTNWFADPRLYRLSGRMFLYWNSGWHEPQNHQFLQEFDSATLRPIGNPRELRLQGTRQKLEKNWTLFGDGPGIFHAVYSILPHRVLTLSIDGDGDIDCTEVARTEWAIERYPSSHGGLRGGAPPVWVEGRYWSFCHSVHDGAGGYRYAPAVYCFSAGAPFTPLAGPTTPLNLASKFRDHRSYPRLNPAVNEVIYPCGAAHDGTRWFISHGINDERCAVSTVSHETVAASLGPVAGAAK